ncbi:3-dehydroquinate synthase [Tannockella kyphosi]|uniref:3-dehydroquinate synthase n=1 Tax=Tannockella kyphosi TaxID=2899121 RepID=UPI0020138059|nr:3-dehydroquinate synthase [Tannockella kyphosi]
MKMIVDLGKDSYPIFIEKGILTKLDLYIKDVFQGKKIMIISDDNVYGHYGKQVEDVLSKQYEVSSIVVEHGEKAKRFDILPSLYKQLLNAKITRTDCIIALGGGVIGDLAGFVAATYLRGIPFVQIPTSLLAQVDSSVGGKVAVDLPEGKNLIGAFYHPKLVLIDPTTLLTLSDHFISDGMGEVIKYGCIKDAKLFEQLLNYQDFKDLYQDIDQIIYRCVDCKRIVVENDLYDFGDRLILNFGHTLAHAIEQYYHYENYSHGQAVGIGMVQLTHISEQTGMTVPGTADLIASLLEKYHIPTACGLKTKDLLQAISLDKKNIHSSLSYVILKEIGQTIIYKGSHDFVLNKEVI